MIKRDWAWYEQLHGFIERGLSNPMTGLIFMVLFPVWLVLLTFLELTGL